MNAMRQAHAESVKNDKPTISMSLSHCIHQTLNSKASTRFHSGGLQQRSEERFSRNAETDLVCRLLLEKKKVRQGTPRRALGRERVTGRSVRSLRPSEGDPRGGGLTSACSRRRRAAEPGSYGSDVHAFAADALIVRCDALFAIRDDCALQFRPARKRGR